MGNEKLKQSTARNLLIFMCDSADHVTGKVGLTLTINISKDGSGFGSINPVVTDLGSGWYNLALTIAHTDTLGDLAFHISSAGADPTDFKCEVVAYDPQSSTNLGLSFIPAAVAEETSLSDAADEIAFLRRCLTNKRVWDAGGSRWEIYDDAGVAVLYYLAVTTPAGGPVTLDAAAIANGDKIA